MKDWEEVLKSQNQLSCKWLVFELVKRVIGEENLRKSPFESLQSGGAWWQADLVYF